MWTTWKCAPCGLTILLTQLQWVVPQGPENPLPHLPLPLVMNPVPLLGDLTVVILPLQSILMVLSVFTMVTLVAGYVQPTLLWTRPDDTMTHVLLQVPCSAMAIPGIAVL